MYERVCAHTHTLIHVPHTQTAHCRVHQLGDKRLPVGELASQKLGTESDSKCNVFSCQVSRNSTCEEVEQWKQLNTV